MEEEEEEDGTETAMASAAATAAAVAVAVVPSDKPALPGFVRMASGSVAAASAAASGVLRPNVGTEKIIDVKNND